MDLTFLFRFPSIQIRFHFFPNFGNVFCENITTVYIKYGSQQQMEIEKKNNQRGFFWVVRSLRWYNFFYWWVGKCLWMSGLTHNLIFVNLQGLWIPFIVFSSPLSNSDQLLLVRGCREIAWHILRIKYGASCVKLRLYCLSPWKFTDNHIHTVYVGK